MSLFRRLSLLLALGCGCIALAWGLFHLRGIFVEERQDALSEIAARRQALEQYAHQELNARLRNRLAEARPSIDAAARDPLLPARELLLFDRGEQLLPRLLKSGGSVSNSASVLYRALRNGQAARLAEREGQREADSPWHVRLQLFAALDSALAAHDRSGIETVVRRILAHRAAYLISVTHDLPYTAAMLDRLSASAKPDPALMRLVLRDGFRGRAGSAPGLQRGLLDNRHRFSPSDFRFQAKQIADLSRPHNVLYTDFMDRVGEAAVAQPRPPTLNVPAFMPQAGPTVAGELWYLEPPKRERIYGVLVSFPALLSEITAAMRGHGLLGPRDLVRGQAARGDVANLPLQIDSPGWAPAAAAVQKRYRLKAALEVVIAVLAFGVLALGVLVYRRKQRFVELKSDFVSAVSHELRTPLASIRLMAETLERRTKDVPGVRDYPTRIIRDIDGLSFLVENILSFNRLSRGRWTPHKAQLRLSDIVDKLQVERDLWAHRPAELEGEELEPVLLHADRDLVQLLITNLIRNACQYSERAPATIRISAEASDKCWTVLVADNGVGIPEAEQEKIFDDFYRSKEGGGRGSGLGLAICRKVMEAHGGSIRVAESSSAGTTFELIFPLPAKSSGAAS